MPPRKPKQRATISSALAELGLADHEARLAPYARPEIHLVPDDAGRSRLGGEAVLPPGAAWPCHRWPLAEVARWPEGARAAVDAAKKRGQAFDDGDQLAAPLPFLAVVDLAEVADERLPKAGLLAFFAGVTTDIEDPAFAKRVGCAVIHVPAAPATRAAPPTFDQGPAGRAALRAEHVIAWDIPYDDRSELVAVLPKTGASRLWKAADRSHHALFPSPSEECAGRMPPAGFVALARFNDDSDAEFYVGDASWITFVLPEEDLAAQRFDRARASVFIG